MPSFSAKSKLQLSTCHTILQDICNIVVVDFDCTIIEGHRSKARQNRLFMKGGRITRVHWPHSMHNKVPSLAVDMAPYPIDWRDRERFHMFAGYVLGVAKTMGHELRWGGDWDRDTEVDDNSFDDLPHFELVGVV